MSAPIAILLLFLTAPLIGCVASESGASRAGRQAYYLYDFDKAVSEFRRDDKSDGQNAVLRQFRLASAALGGGDTYDALRALLSADQTIVSNVGKGRGTASLISAEGLKVFKGEPFEKAMTYFYLGAIFYQQGDYENARAGFSKALLMDKQSDEAHREDMALVFYMLGKCYLRLGDSENAKLAFKKAGDRSPGSPYGVIDFFDGEKAQKANVTVIVELGHVPQKFREGPGASMDVFRERQYPERRVKIFADGQFLGKTAKAMDLLFEAKTRGTSGKDAVQVAKGVAREAAVATAVISRDERVQVGALLFALANQSQADVRQWDMLPGELQVFSGWLEPGLRTLRLEFENSYGGELPTYRQVWYYLPVDKQKDNLFLFRSGPSKADGSYLKYAPQGDAR